MMGFLIKVAPFEVVRSCKVERIGLKVALGLIKTDCELTGAPLKGL